MASSEDHRRYAASCLALAENLSTPEDKARLIEMAQAFLELASKREKKDMPSKDD